MEAILRQLLELSPPFLVHLRGQTAATNTRPPSEYDKKLHDELILRRVLPCPSILEALLQEVDRGMANVSFQLAGAETEDAWSALLLDLPDLQFHYESQLREWYQVQVAQKCIPLACFLLNKNLDPAQNRMFKWDSVADHTAGSGGVADGFLKRAPANLHLPEDISEGDQNLTRHLRNGFLVWEFKTPEVLNPDVEHWISMITHNRAFRWCRSADGVSDSDAIKENVSCDMLDEVLPCVGQKMAEFGLNRVSTRPDTRTIRTGPVSRRGDGTTNEECAVYMIQQAWAQAVKYDATFLVITCGNSEWIGIRHRKSQSLFLSEKLTARKESYIKLHVGLYIAGYRDAILRATQVAEVFRGATESECHKEIKLSWTKWKGDPADVVPSTSLQPPDEILSTIQSVKWQISGEKTNQWSRYEGGASQLKRRLNEIARAPITKFTGNGLAGSSNTSPPTPKRATQKGSSKVQSKKGDTLPQPSPIQDSENGAEAEERPAKRARTEYTLYSEVTARPTAYHYESKLLRNGKSDLSGLRAMQRTGTFDCVSLHKEYLNYQLLVDKTKHPNQVLRHYGIFRKDDAGDTMMMVCDNPGDLLMFFGFYTNGQRKAFLNQLQLIHDAGLLHPGLEEKHLYLAPGRQIGYILGLKHLKDADSNPSTAAEQRIQEKKTLEDILARYTEVSEAQMSELLVAGKINDSGEGPSRCADVELDDKGEGPSTGGRYSANIPSLADVDEEPKDSDNSIKDSFDGSSIADESMTTRV